MERPEQIALLETLLHYVETGTTALAPAPWRNETVAYTDPARFQREVEVLFRGHPLLMGLSCELPQPGDWKTDDYAGVPILLVRDRKGVLRAFLNACRHRGAKLADGCGNAKALSCPYHAWSYDLAGKLTFVPDERNFPGLEPERRGLRALPLCEKDGMVWVIPTPAADGATSFDIDPWLAGLGPELASYDLSRYHHYETRTLTEPMNWKLVSDTFFEGYHIGFLHQKTLVPILHGNVTAFSAWGPHHRMTVPRQKLLRLRQTPVEQWDAMWNTTMLYSLFPNTIFVPQGDHMEIWRIFPAEGRIDSTVMTIALYTPKPATTAEERRHWDANLDLLMQVVLTEDFPAGRGIQMGFGTGAQSHTIYGRNEPAMIHWHQAVRRAIGLPVDAALPAAAAAE